VGIGVEAEVTDGDLTLVWNMRSDPGDELEIGTLLWTEKPEWRQPAIFSTRASEMSSWRRRREKTSRLKNSANKLS
jgi:hypothetical protein